MTSIKTKKMIPVILCGGSGTRLWPLSRAQQPKQFMPLTSEDSLLQETLSRLAGCSSVAEPVLVCNEEHRFTVAEQVRKQGIKSGAIILEPRGRNTAPAIAVSALAIAEPDDILLVLPSDHVFTNQEAFSRALAQAADLATSGSIVTFGIRPTHPETGYGYIRLGAQLGTGDAHKVASFVEKPNLDRAKAYIASGEYLWNSGMFAFRAGDMLAELESFRPDILAACSAASSHAKFDMDFIRPDEEAFLNCPSESIDYAVIERTSKAVTISIDAGWSDVGSWSSLWDVSDKDQHGNSIRGDVLAHDTENCLIRADKRLISTIGLKDIVVVDTDDAVMIAARDRVQDVKVVVQQLSTKKRAEVLTHRKVYRPWGWYDSIDMGPRHQVKRISVNPGAKLSLQMHFHRAEHWVIVKGTAKITLDDREIILTEDQSTYIPLGTRHRLENIGKIPLEIIEVQTGSYLGEDDIVRFSDDYGRHNSIATPQTLIKALRATGAEPEVL